MDATDKPLETKPTPSVRGFEILEKIGEGGMGTVYRARQRSLDRLVALKVLTPRLSSDRAYIESFRREAQAAARLHHPNIIPVYDAGEANGVYYYAMEFVHGKTLFRWVQRTRLPETTVVEIGLCVASALKHAWDKEKLIHCDVKPENIMVDADGNVKLCDLGLAKVSGESGLGPGGHLFGTPNYVSPEQARGVRTLDQRSDIYSLGLTLYYALTGVVPFSGHPPDIVLVKQRKEQLPDVREIAPNVSAHICRVLEKMLAKDPADRYQDWGEVLRDLELVRRNKPPQCRPPAGTSTLKLSVVVPSIRVPPSSRRPLLLAVIGAFVVVLAAFIMMLLIPASPSVPAVKWKPRTVRPPEPQPQPPPLVDGAPKMLREAEDFARHNPRAYEEIAERLRAIIRNFPESEEAVTAQHMLDAIAKRQAEEAAEEEQRRAKEEEARRYAEQRMREEAARAEAERRFGEFVQSFRQLLSKRNYAEAAIHAQQVANDPSLALARRNVEACQKVAERLRQFWESFPETIGALVGRSLALQGITGTLTEINDGNIALEKIPGAVIDIPIAGLATGEVLTLLCDSAGTDNKEAMLNAAWFSFAEGAQEQGFEYLDAARRAGADTGADRRLMEQISKGVEEYEAWAILQRLRILVRGDQPAEARAQLAQLQKRYEQTSTVRAAQKELARIAVSISLAESAARLPAGSVVRTFRGHEGAVTCGVLSPDGRYVLSTGADTKVKLWDTTTGTEVRHLRGHDTSVLCAAFTPGGNYAVTGSAAPAVRLWEIATGRDIKTLKGHTAPIMGIAVSPDGRFMLTGSFDKTIKLWDLVSGNEMRTFSGHTAPVRGVAFTPDGRFAISASFDKTLRLWDVATGKNVRTFSGHTDEVKAVVVSTDGRCALSGSKDGTMKLWDIATGKEIRTFRGHDADLRGVDLSEDGRYALSAGSDKLIKLWDVETGRVLRTLEGHADQLRSVVFSPDGRYALSASDDKTLKLWKLWAANQPAPPASAVAPVPPAQKEAQ